MLTEPDALPGAQSDAALADRQSQIGAQETGLGVGGHVVRALAAVLPRDGFRHKPGHYTLFTLAAFKCVTPVEHHLHVVPNIRVPVLVDGEAGAGVQQLDVHDPHLAKV